MTITSDTRAGLIGDALRSVLGWVDLCLIIHLVDPAAVPDGTLAEARSVAGGKLRIVDLPIATPFAEARNAGLVEAARLGGTWGVILDTDERILPGGGAVRQALLDAPGDVTHITVMEDTGNYDKVRFLRLPCPGRYRHGVHEDFTCEGRAGNLLQVRFHEVPKPPETVRANFLVQLAGLEAQCQAEPDHPRWQYYRGRVLEAMGRPGEALAAYEASLRNLTHPGTLAWTFFVMARCLHAQARHQVAREVCIRGLAHRPDYPELHWLAGVQCLHLGLYRDALAWARLAVVFTWRGAKEADVERTGDKEPLALFEGPWQVMAAAFGALGQEGERQEALREVARAEGERVAFFAPGQSLES